VSVTPKLRIHGFLRSSVPDRRTTERSSTGAGSPSEISADERQVRLQLSLERISRALRRVTGGSGRDLYRVRLPRRFSTDRTDRQKGAEPIHEVGVEVNGNARKKRGQTRLDRMQGERRRQDRPRAPNAFLGCDDSGCCWYS